MYTISDFQIFSVKNDYELNKTTLNVIRYLEDNIIIPNDEQENTMRRTDAPTIKRQGSKSRGSGTSHFSRSKTTGIEEKWEAIPALKPTKMVLKEGIEKSINDIRVLLNKISAKNYDIQKTAIIEAVLSLCINDGENVKEDKRRVVETIFTIASANKMMSELYADLYLELVKTDAMFNDIMIEFVEQYKSSIFEIHYVDANVDYDGFCKYNKINDLRKSLAIFIVNLMKRGLVSRSHVMSMIDQFQKTSFEYVDQENKTNEVEEITENIFILISMCKSISEIVSDSFWIENIQTNIENFSKMKAKDHVSLSSRVVFKYMDMK